MAALTSNGVGTCGADDNQAQAGHLVCITGERTHAPTSEGADASEDGTGQGTPIVADATVRRLTELECERLQGYPDGWTEAQSGAARYRQLGNSVAVPVVEWIARRLVQIDKEVR